MCDIQEHEGDQSQFTGLEYGQIFHETREEYLARYLVMENLLTFTELLRTYVRQDGAGPLGDSLEELASSLESQMIGLTDRRGWKFIQ